MRLGAPVFLDQPDPEKWIAALRDHGYRAAYCPVDSGASTAEIQAYAAAAAKADIIIAEVGVWNNPLASDEQERAEALTHCRRQLALAEEIGAACCVNVAGSRGLLWDGPHPDNLTRETFDMIVEVVRSVIDDVRPRRTFYTLEPMPWIFPDSPDSNLDLIRAVDRSQFAVHLDPVNMISSPQRFFANTAFLQECFDKLGPYIKSVHAKDILISDQLTTHLDEARPGMGHLDYRTFLREMDKLPADVPFMLEHLPTEEDYLESARYVRSVAAELNISL